jgi:hypothetical protein
MSAEVLVIRDEHDRRYGPTRRQFVTTDEAVAFAMAAIGCSGHHGEVVAVLDEDGDEVDVGLSGTEDGDVPPAHSALKAEWEQYAKDHGVQYPSDATKADIIALVEGK